MVTEMTSTLQQLSGGLAAVSDSVWPSVVQVRNGKRGIGAGTIVRRDGLIVTNAHVVGSVQSQRHKRGHSQNVQNQNGNNQIVIRLMDGREAPAQIVAVDTDHDLAALAVDLPDLTPIPLANGEALRAGMIVMALGFPWGVAGGATSGVVIEGPPTEPVQRASTEDRAASDRWLAASLHLRPGHSGGPMVNGQGELVGINTLMSGPDVGVAIPVHLVVHFLNGIDVMQRKDDVVYV